MAPILNRDEYVEQAYCFRMLQERQQDNIPLQDLLQFVREEILATTRLPMAIDYLLAELRHVGVMHRAMARMAHYFTPFQTYLIQEAESERSRFDIRIALEILQFEAQYRSQAPTPTGIFLYQFESLCRNRLRYDPGLAAVAEDPIFSRDWKEWILGVRRNVGILDLADMIYVRSEHAMQRRRPTPPDDGESPTEAPSQSNFQEAEAQEEFAQTKDAQTRDDQTKTEAPSPPEANSGPLQGLAGDTALWGEKEGRIALANRRKDPLYLFAAMQRHLGYPIVPRPKKVDETPQLIPQLLRRLERYEARLKLLEEEARGGIDITKFYGQKPPEPPE